MGKYKPYPEYKDSGVEWLGDVPESWKHVPIKREFKIINGSTPKSNIEQYWDGNVTWITPADLSDLGRLSVASSRRMITEEGLLSCGTTLVPEGSIIVSCRAPIGAVALAGRELCTNQGCKSLVKLGNCSSTFYSYFLCSMSNILNGLGRGTTFLELSSEILGCLKTPSPSCEEQKHIAAFLDHETAKIDRLIEKQEKLIELLKEKRQAVISHAVTKGLNPDAPMKDSGVEWLGEVPEHWKLKPLKLVVMTRKGVAFKSTDFQDNGVRVVKASDIKLGTLREAEVYLPNEFLAKYPKAILREADIVLSTVGSTPDVKNSAVGQLGMVPKGMNNVLLNQNTVVFDPNTQELLPHYLFFILSTAGYRDHLDLNAHGTANQASLNVQDMLNFYVILPSFEEQGNIVESLQLKLATYLQVEQKMQKQIVLLKERRTALISAAVTGKIDVRDWNKD